MNAIIIFSNNIEKLCKKCKLNPVNTALKEKYRQYDKTFSKVIKDAKNKKYEIIK